MGGGASEVEMNPNLIREIASLHWNSSNSSLALSYGLAIQTVSWEDTARSKNSCWGPNIADLTLNVTGSRLPMIRKPNFADTTADVPMSLFNVTAGNEKPSGELKRVSFKDYVSNTLDLPDLILERDDVLLASAQACVLPCGTSGETEFCPQLFSYQARPNDPAVLVIVASSQGTSAHVITGATDMLYFNRGGEKAMFLAKRLRQDRAERGVPLEGKMTDEELDRNAILIFQIPLKQKERPPLPPTYSPFLYAGTAKGAPYPVTLFGSVPTSAPYTTFGASAPVGQGFGPPQSMPVLFGCSAPPTARCAAPGFPGMRIESAPKAGLEYATLRASDKTYGAFPELSRSALQRDERFPIRVTFQMYTVTDDPVLKEAQVQDLAERIAKVYASGPARGSLVTNNTERATEPRPLLSVQGAEHKPLFQMAA